MFFKMAAGRLFQTSEEAVTGAFRTELMFVLVCVAALATALFLRRSSRLCPDLHLDEPAS